jgi:hypothetical protein
MDDTGSRPSRRTLTFGGAALVLASIGPLVSLLVFVFPPPGESWLYAFAQPIFAQACTAILVVATVILAVGLPGEDGIVRSSVIGRVALIAYGVVNLASALLNGSLPTDPGSLWVLPIVNSSLSAVAFIALVVAAAAVVRAGVVRGAGRWGLVAVAIASFVQLATIQTSIGPSDTIMISAVFAGCVIQLATGVLYIVAGRTEDARRAAPVAADS